MEEKNLGSEEYDGASEEYIDSQEGVNDWSSRDYEEDGYGEEQESFESFGEDDT